MEIVKASAADNEILTAITKMSKAYWGFTEDVLKEWSHLLTITKDYIEKNNVYKLVHDDQIIGYYSYFPTSEHAVKLDNIFILPEFIGQGFGRILMIDFLEKVKQSKINKINLDAEPKAEEFYKLFGFKTIGQLESSIKDRFLPIMQLKIVKNSNS